jgi:hypothetical protein
VPYFLLWENCQTKPLISRNKGGTKMKTQKLLLIAAIVCLLVGASGTAMAQHPVPFNHLQPAEIVAKVLASQGYEVKADRDGNFVMIDTDLGEVTVSLDEKVVMLDEEDGPFDLVQCFLASIDIYQLKLKICEFQTLDSLCAIRSTYGLTLDILSCVGDPG